jgi:hypothetical protein
VTWLLTQVTRKIRPRVYVRIYAYLAGMGTGRFVLWQFFCPLVRSFSPVENTSSAGQPPSFPYPFPTSGRCKSSAECTSLSPKKLPSAPGTASNRSATRLMSTPSPLARSPLASMGALPSISTCSGAIAQCVGIPGGVFPVCRPCRPRCCRLWCFHLHFRPPDYNAGVHVV